MVRTPAAFLSYVQFNDKHDNGRLTELRERLEREVEVHTGEKFPIFQDRNDLAWGQAWKERIEDVIDAATFLIVIVTPSYFKSPPCRQEFERFREREAKLKRDDLILPLLYVDVPTLTDELKRAADQLAVEIARRQSADWRDLRFEPWTSPDVGKRLAKMAVQLRDAMERGGPVAQPGGGGTQVPKEGTEVGPGSASSGKAVSQPVPSESGVQSEVGESRRGPSSRIEPPTLVVDPMPGRGDHTTIGAAIAAAKAGGRIFVRPGLYKEGLHITKPIEIVGDGPREEIIIEAAGRNAIWFQTDFGRVANLTVRQTDHGRLHAIDVAQGRPEIDSCDISSRSLACVSIHNGADPRLRRNLIHGGTQSGVFVHSNGKGTLEDNDIFGNHYSGIEIRAGGDPAVRRNRIHDGLASGVLVHERGGGALEDNDIFGNKLAGIEIRTDGNPIVRRNRVHDQLESGVYVHTNGKGTFEDNDIFGNKLVGMSIKTGGDPIVRRNRIHDGRADGVLVHDNGKGTYEDNQIVSNGEDGIAIQQGAAPTVRRNQIWTNTRWGVWISRNSAGRFENNELIGNKKGAWSIDPSSAANVIRKDNTEK